MVLTQRALGVAMAGWFVGALPMTARAQTSPPITDWRIGVAGGVTAVQHVAGQVTVEVVRQARRFGLVGEAAWLEDVITRRREQRAYPIALQLANTERQVATFDVKAPAIYVGIGARVFLTGPHRVRLYATGTAGAAHLRIKSAFTVDGRDVTAELGTYGISLGSDLSGSTTNAAATGGIGVQIGSGSRWQLDLTVRATSIRLGDQIATAKRAALGITTRF